MIYMEKKVNKSLYEDKHSKFSTRGTGFKNKLKAIETLKIIKDRDIIYQKQVVNTMYNRAKYHPYKNKDMEDAMKIFEKWLKEYPKLKKDEDNKYQWLPLKIVKKYEKIAEKYKVSEVARGIKKGTKTDKGFLEMYKKVLGKQHKLQYIPVKENRPTGQDYWSYRIGFLNSRLGQMHKAKTPLYYEDGLPTKQHIILIIHGYSPDNKIYED